MNVNKLKFTDQNYLHVYAVNIVHVYKNIMLATFLKFYLVADSCTQTSESCITWSWNELGVSDVLKTWVEGEKSGHACFQKPFKMFWKYNRWNLC